MKRKVKWLLACAGAVLAGLGIVPLLASPSVYPTGTTIYDPSKTEDGFTVLTTLETPAVLVIDMNGRLVKRWDGFDLFSGGPARVLPGGIVVAPRGVYPRHLESTALVARDFDGREIWAFERAETIELDGERQWSARQHHDWQLENWPAGYYAPGAAPDLMQGRKLLLTHSSHTDSAIADVELDDDRIVELDETGKIVWEWRAGDHIGEFGFDEKERTAIRRNAQRDGYDWLHLNSATYLGPNKWFDAGDKRFDPENVIVSSRQASLVAIIARDGSVVWQVGPDFSATAEEAKIGQIIGQHHAHLIPPGLPGAGNLLVFDNGGSSGYGDPSPLSATGYAIYARASSRVLEIDPVTLEVVWSYTAPNFYSFNISGAQRLANGNTLVTEGAPGRIFEVTPDKEIVWEYVSPPGETGRKTNAVYRAYRIPYSWIPQLPVPEETAVERPEPGTFHVPAAPEG